MKKILFFIAALSLLIAGCNEKDEAEYIFPLDYFPAYPESYWIYSDGTTIKVSPGYHKHHYYEELESNVTTSEVYVPKINSQYVYEYAITQNNNRVPLKKLLSENYAESWTVDYFQDGKIKRKVINKDTSISLTAPVSTNDQQTFDSCIVVIEYYEDTIAHTWQTKEIYAPKVGMIRQEIRRGEDSLVAKELIRYYISEDI